VLEIVADRPLFDNEIARRAEAGHYETRPKVVETLAFRREGYAVQHYYQEEILGKVPMVPDSLHAFFNRYPGRWNSPAALDAHIILVESNAVADSLVKVLKAGGDFAKSAMIGDPRGGPAAAPWHDLPGQARPAMERLLLTRRPIRSVGPTRVRRLHDPAGDEQAAAGHARNDDASCT
jgi:hypothetical protein